MPRPAPSRPAISPMCWARTSGSRWMCSPTFMTDSQFDPEELSREKNVIIQEIGAVEDTPDDLVFDLLSEAAWPDQPLGRPILGTRESVAALRPRRDPRLSQSPLSRRRQLVVGAGAVDHDALVDARGRKVARPRRRDAASRRAGALSRRRDADQEAARTDPCRRRLRGPRRPRRRPRRRACFRRGDGRRHVVAAVSGGAREARPRLFDPCVPLGLSPRPACSASMPARAAKEAGELIAAALDCLAEAGEHLERGRSRARQGADEGFDADGARIAGRASSNWRDRPFLYGAPLTLEEMTARIDAIDVADARAAGAAMLKSAADRRRDRPDRQSDRRGGSRAPARADKIAPWRCSD